jgi:very-short-patch-repair endonuclease
MKEYRDNLTYAAKPDIFKKASLLRQEMTSAEKVLWKCLRNRKLNGLKFRRQHPLDIFIADFYCHEKKLIIELDGGIHDTLEQKEYDEGRSFELKEKGFQILRFKNKEVLNNIEDVVQTIIEFSLTI